jgi:hypothetical protein
VNQLNCYCKIWHKYYTIGGHSKLVHSNFLVSVMITWKCVSLPCVTALIPIHILPKFLYGNGTCCQKIIIVAVSNCLFHILTTTHHIRRSSTFFTHCNSHSNQELLFILP